MKKPAKSGDLRAFRMVGVARIELATPTMSTQRQRQFGIAIGGFLPKAFVPDVERAKNKAGLRATFAQLSRKKVRRYVAGAPRASVSQLTRRRVPSFAVR